MASRNEKETKRGVEDVAPYGNQHYLSRAQVRGRRIPWRFDSAALGQGELLPKVGQVCMRTYQYKSRGKEPARNEQPRAGAPPQVDNSVKFERVASFQWLELPY